MYFSYVGAALHYIYIYIYSFHAFVPFAFDANRWKEWEKETLASRDIMPEAPDIKWEDLQPKVPTANATS